MKDQILEFIHSFQMTGNGKELINSFNFKASKKPINDNNSISVEVKDFQHAVDLIKSLNSSFDNNKIKNDLKSSLVNSLISEHQPFHLTFFVKGAKRIF